MYLAPVLTVEDLTRLRAGETVLPKKATIYFPVKKRLNNGDEVVKRGSVPVVAEDIEQVNTYFGDRPLNNPGYSEFDLLPGSSVQAGNQSNDVLDLYRVEHRLKYLGYSAYTA